MCSCCLRLQPHPAIHQVRLPPSRPHPASQGQQGEANPGPHTLIHAECLRYSYTEAAIPMRWGPVISRSHAGLQAGYENSSDGSASHASRYTGIDHLVRYEGAPHTSPLHGPLGLTLTRAGHVCMCAGAAEAPAAVHAGQHARRLQASGVRSAVLGVPYDMYIYTYT